MAYMVHSYPPSLLDGCVIEVIPTGFGVFYPNSRVMGVQWVSRGTTNRFNLKEIVSLVLS